jgi:Na+-driven multidrug efflux pump
VIFVCYWVLGLPLAAVFAFHLKLGYVGLWYGMYIAVGTHALAYIVMLFKYVSIPRAIEKASERMQAEHLPVGSVQ